MTFASYTFKEGLLKQTDDAPAMTPSPGPWTNCASRADVAILDAIGRPIARLALDDRYVPLDQVAANAACMTGALELRAFAELVFEEADDCAADASDPCHDRGCLKCRAAAALARLDGLLPCLEKPRG